MYYLPVTCICPLYSPPLLDKGIKLPLMNPAPLTPPLSETNTNNVFEAKPYFYKAHVKLPTVSSRRIFMAQ